MAMSSESIRLLLTRWRDDALIYLLTLSHATMPTVRFCRNNQTIISRGETFSPAPFDVKLMDDKDELGAMSVSIPNVDRAIGRAVLAINVSLDVTLEAVFASNPDDVWKAFRRLELHDVSFGGFVLQGTVSYKRINHEPFPNRRVIPNKFFAYFR